MSRAVRAHDGPDVRLVERTEPDHLACLRIQARHPRVDRPEVQGVLGGRELEDRVLVENISKLQEFLAPGGPDGMARMLASLGPREAAMAAELLPEIALRLSSRVSARLLRSAYLPSAR